MIQVNKLTHRYGNHLVLDQLCFNIEQGEIFGLLGPSGAGKTTLIKILTGQLKQEDGTAMILGKDTRQLSATEYQQIGCMMDDFDCYERLSVYDNLVFYADIFQVSRSKIVPILLQVGLDNNLKTPVSKLSKGMKNRCLLARALLNQGKILFLDEPTAGLDPLTTQDIHALLKQQQVKGTTIFLTTHNMVEATLLCDHVALLDEGSIVEYGTPNEICMKYNHLNQLKIILKDGEEITCENNNTSASFVKEHLEKNHIQSIHSTEPTLEKVFIELTGKKLNDQE